MRPVLVDHSVFQHRQMSLQKFVVGGYTYFFLLKSRCQNQGDGVKISPIQNFTFLFPDKRAVPKKVQLLLYEVLRVSCLQKVFLLLWVQGMARKSVHQFIRLD